MILVAVKEDTGLFMLIQPPARNIIVESMV